MRVELISDLCEIDGWEWDYVLDSFYDYLTEDQRIKFAREIEMVFNLDVDSMTIQEAIDEDIVSAESILLVADTHFNNFVHKDFINNFLKEHSK